MSNAPLVVIARNGMPFTPPVIDGETFRLLADDVWLALVTEEKAQHMTRVPNYRRFGGKVPDGFFPGVTVTVAPPPSNDPALPGDAGAPGGAPPAGQDGTDGTQGGDGAPAGSAPDGLSPEIASLTRKELAAYAFEKFKAPLELGRREDMLQAVQKLINDAKGAPKE
jgi:hypothetical protein